MTTVSVDVTTGDVAPAVAPHRISGQATKDVATLTITPEASEGLLPSDDLLPEEPYLPISDTFYLNDSTYFSEGLLPDADETQIAGVRINVGGVSPYTGTLVGRKGLPCSDSLPCSGALPCSDWESTAGTPIAEDVTHAELGGVADGDYTVNVWVDYAGEWR